MNTMHTHKAEQK